MSLPQIEITPGRRPLDSPQGVLFVHVPKTAGSSMVRALEGELGYNPSPWMHASAYNIRQCEPKLWRDAFTFGFARNPFDQVVSWWLYHQRKGHLVHCQFDSFEEWVKEGMPHGWGPGVHQMYGGTYWYEPWGDWRLAPQPYDLCKMLCDPDTDELLVDYVGFFEDLDRHWTAICERVIGKRVELPHRNVSHHRKHYSEYYPDQTTIDLVAQKHAKAIEVFSYGF